MVDERPGCPAGAVTVTVSVAVGAKAVGPVTKMTVEVTRMVVICV